MTRTEKATLKQRRADVLEDRLFGLALHAAHEMTQVCAAARLHAMYNGAPLARNLTAKTDDIGLMTADDIRAELARLKME